MAIQDQFTQILGRVPTSAEMAYLQKFINEGSLQEHEIGQILQASPEFQSSQLEKNMTAYGQKLQANDQQIMQQGADIAGAQAQSRFAGLGRPNSSALAASVFGQQGQLAGSLAQSRQSALADFYGRGLQQNQALYGQQGQGALERGYGLRDETRQRGYQIEDRNYMRAAYDDYLNQQRRSSRAGAFGSLGGGLGGALIGGIAGSYFGPGGAKAGAQLGGSIGSQSGSLFR